MEHFETVDQLLSRAISAFEAQFKYKPNCASVAPGRVNIIGEHTDYNDGFVFPMALPLVTIIVGAKTENDICRVKTDSDSADDPKYVEFTLPNESRLLEPGHPKWANYVKGVVSCFPFVGQLPSFDAAVVSSVPLGGGLSSSASLEVATFTFLESLLRSSCNSTIVSSVDSLIKAQCCQRAEHTFANMPCGIMDQFVSTMGKAGHALFIDCRSLHGRLVELRDPDIVFLITNSNVRHELSSSEYPVRRQQCEQAAAVLGRSKLRDVSLVELEAVASQMDALIYRRARHVVTENERCEEAAKALEAGDFESFGRLMKESHASLRDDYEVSCTELDDLVNLACQVDGVFGARMTGGGFGGCTVTMVRKDAIDSVIKHIKEHYIGRPQFYVCQAADGTKELSLSSMS